MLLTVIQFICCTPQIVPCMSQVDYYLDTVQYQESHLAAPDHPLSFELGEVHIFQ